MKSPDRNELLSKHLQHLLNHNGDNLRFSIKHLKKNKLVLLHPLQNLCISIKDPFISLHQHKAIRQNVWEIESISENQFFFIIKTLCLMFMQTNDHSTFFFNNSKIVQYQSSFEGLNICSVKSSNDRNFLHNSNILNLYLYYFYLINDYNFLERMNEELVKKIKESENIYADSKEMKFCKICLVLKEELQILKEKYNNISKNYTVAQMEKERSVMKYATGEKRLIEAQK